MSLEVVILAAGQGTRMRSRLPKVLHQVAGRSLVQHVINCAKGLGAEKIHVVIGHGGDTVEAEINDEQVDFSLQAEQLGTGHAVAQAMPKVKSDSTVLILYGDVPLIRQGTLHSLLDLVNEDHIALLTVALEDPTGYGRIIRDEDDCIQAIVEQKDASPEQLSVKEVNTGIMAVPASRLKSWLPRLSSDNAQGEYYLTDVIGLAVADGLRVVAANPKYEQEVSGVNNRQQLSVLERWYQARQAERLMESGATLRDPARIDVRGELEIGQDVIVDVNVVFEGVVTIGRDVTIGPNCVITNSCIGDNVVIKANTVVEDAVVGHGAVLGPFCRLRPGSVLDEGARIGNFVEIKKSHVGAGSKVNHLSYVGDALIGRGVNIGAGTITCNYDGVNKSQTTLKDDVFIGSNSSLVAPLTVGEGATVGAGSTITADVGDHQLAVGRNRQRNVSSWKRPVKKI